MMDSKDNPIAKDWATIDTTVKLRGTVVRGREVDVFDGATLLGKADITGIQWEYTASGLGAKRYAFRAKECGGRQSESDVWSVTVGIPYISGGSTPNGGHSSDEVVFLTGIARPDQWVVFFYQGREMTRVQAGPNGSWGVPVTLFSTFNTFEVGVLGEELRSPSWRMTFDIQ